MNIVIPLAGPDPRFDVFGTHKPLIDVGGLPLMRRCTDSLGDVFVQDRHQLIFIILKAMETRYPWSFADRLRDLYPGCQVIQLDHVTEGAASTVLAAKSQINNGEDLLVYLADIIFEADFSRIRSDLRGTDGIIPTLPSDHIKYSYARTEGSSERVLEVAEKKVISDHASAGFYYFKRGSDFVTSAEQMIQRELRTKNLFFMCPVYNQLIEQGLEVKILSSTFVAGLGSPEEVYAYRNQNQN